MTEPGIEAADTKPNARDGAETSFFISYTREDLPFRTRLRTAMLSAGRRVWVDEDIPPLADWREEVLAAIVGADIFVFVLSPDSLVSQACLEELSLALSSSKRIAPIVCRDVEGLPLPAGLSEPNWVFFRDQDSFDRSLAELLTAADTDVAWVKTHTRLAVRAKDWDERDRDESLLLRGRDLETGLVWLAQAAAHGHGDASNTQVEYLEASRAREADENARLRDQYTRAVARQLAFQSELERGSTPRSVEISALLAAESIGRWRTTEGDQALRRAMAQLPVGPRRTISHDGGQVLALSPDGRVLAVAQGKTIDVWGVGPGGLKHTLSVPGPVVTLTLDEEGTRLLGVDDNRHARLWQVSNGGLVHEFDLPGEPEHVALHPDSASVAVATPGHGIQVFDGSRATSVLDCDIDGEVRAMALANDAKLLVTVCAEGMAGSLRTFDLTTGQALEPFGFDGLVRSAALARGAAFLAVMAVHVGPWMGPERDVNEISVVTLSEEGLPSVELRHQHPIRAFGFTGDGRYLYTVTDRTVGVWRASNGQPLGSVARVSVPRHVAFNAAALRLATAYTDGTVHVTDLVSGTPVMALNRQARAVAFDVAGSLVVSEADRTEFWGDAVGFELMRARPGVEEGTSPGASQRIGENVPPARFSLKGLNATMHGFSPDGRTLLVEGPNHLLTLLDTRERVVRVLDTQPHAGHSAFAADSRHVVTVSVRAAWSSSGDLGDSHVRVRDIGTGVLVSEYERPDSPQFEVNECSALLAHASTGGDQLWVRDSVSGEQTHHVRVTGSVSGLRFSQAGDHLAIVTDDHQLRVLDLLAGDMRTCGPIEASYVRRLDDRGRFALLPLSSTQAVYDVEGATTLAAAEETVRIRDVAMAPGGDLIAVLLEDGGAQIRALPSMRTLVTLGNQLVTGFAFLADGHAVTIEVDDSLHIWRLDDGVEVMPPLEHPDETRTPFVDLAGRLIATGCNDGWVRIWHWRVEDLVAEAHARVDHELSEQELMRFLPDERDDAI